jgi:hypothetical protein
MQTGSAKHRLGECRVRRRPPCCRRLAIAASELALCRQSMHDTTLLVIHMVSEEFATQHADLRSRSKRIAEDQRMD